MPFSTEAARIAGLPLSTDTPKNQAARADTRLGFVGDVIPIPPIRKILSPGDVLIIVGSATVLALAMRRREDSAILE